jgi:hypothetical protein
VPGHREEIVDRDSLGERDLRAEAVLADRGGVFNDIRVRAVAVVVADDGGYLTVQRGRRPPQAAVKALRAGVRGL